MYSSWHFPKEVSISNYIMVKPLLNNMTDASFCYWLTSGYDGINGTVFSYSHGEQWTGIEFGLDLVNDFIPQKNQHDFDFNVESIRVCLAVAESTLDYYIESELVLETSLDQFDVTRSDYFVLGGGEFEGQIHGFAASDRFMEADEIQALFENGCHAAATQDTQLIGME